MKYLSTIINLLAPPPKPSPILHPSLSTILAQARERILTAMLRAAVVLGFLSLLVILPSTVRQDRWRLFALYLVYLGLIYFMAVNRDLNYNFRAGMFVLIQYGLGLTELINFGLAEDGRIFLFSFSVTTSILFNIWLGGGALGLTILTIAVIGWQIITGQLVIATTPHVPSTLSLITMCTNFFMTAGLVIAAVHALLRDFETAWQREQVANSQVQQERDLLEQRVTKRTQELAAARDQALAASHLKTELLAKVSHELRTPLNAILGFAEMLDFGVYGPISDRQRQVVSEIADSTHYLTGLVNELLDQAQLDAGKLKLTITAFEPASLAEEVLSKMRPLAQAKSLALQVEVTPGFPAHLSGDRVRVQQILVNLVSNAIKFTRQGRVQVHLYQPDATHWALQVTDTGIGIPTEAQSFIFEPFRQVDGSLTREQPGTGLGLSIVKHLATLMEGEVSLESKVGYGSTFTVVLPLAPVGAKTVPAPPTFTPWTNPAAAQRQATDLS